MIWSVLPPPVGRTAPNASETISTPASGGDGLPAAEPLAGLLNPDGTLDLATGDRGSVDARGWRLVSGNNEIPRCAPLAGDENWSALGAGLDGTVTALAVDSSGNLYAGRKLTVVGGNDAVGIARWTGTTWSALGSGVDGVVSALAVGGRGRLYAGGEFSTAGGNSATNVTRWDFLNFYYFPVIRQATPERLLRHRRFRPIIIELGGIRQDQAG